MRRLAVRTLDQYDRLTTHLTEHGQQHRTTRAVASTVLTLSVLVVVVTISPVGPTTSTGRGVNAAVALCCVTMSTVGLRHRWPTRGESQFCVVVGALCIAAVCLTLDAPVLSLFSGSVFAVVSAYTAAFHAPRLLAVVWSIAAVTLAVAVARLIGEQTIVALSAGALVVLINVFVALLARLVVYSLQLDSEHGDVDPTTGLLDTVGFGERLATLIEGRTRWDDRRLFVVAVSVDNMAALATEGPAAVHGARVAAARRLRQSVRHGALLAHVSESLYVVGEVSATTDPTPLAKRLHQAMASTRPPMACSVGAISTPLHPLISNSSTDVIDELVGRATTGCARARDGGHPLYVDVDPKLDRLNGGRDCR